MNAPQMAANSLRSAWGYLDEALDGLTEEEITWRPSDDCNSIAFILWHLARLEDVEIHRHVQGKTELYEAEGWREKLGTPPDEDGFGYTKEQVNAWPVPKLADLRGYADSVRQDTLAFLESLPDGKLSEKFGPLGPKRGHYTGNELLLDVMNDTAMHIGQIHYLRGQLRGLSHRPI
ncbi:MAG: DinB family protein [Dehalococcoidales bacterium]